MQDIYCVLNKTEYKVLRSIGANIRKHRIKSGISQSQLAFEINTSLRQIQRIETGTANVGFIYFYRISEALNISIHDLLKIN